MDAKARILIVEDNALLLDTYSTFFTNANFEVYTAVNGLDALGLIMAGDFKVVFTDYSMPLLNGVELITKCQALPKKLPAFILNIDRSDLQKIGDTSRFFAVLCKGTDAVRLLATVEKSIVQTTLVHEDALMSLFEMSQSRLYLEKLCITPQPEFNL